MAHQDTITRTLPLLRAMTHRSFARRLEPMYATIADAMPAAGEWTYEPKFDGMRVLAEIRGGRVALTTRNGHDKAVQFPEIVAALRTLAKRRTLVLDGEIVMLRRGGAGDFQSLQGRFHVRDAATSAALAAAAPATLVLFDVLVDEGRSVGSAPWHERRARLERIAAHLPDRLRLSESSTSGRRMLARATRAGWEGVIAKRIDAPYAPGARSDAWRKLKVQHRAEFVVGGYTEPRRSRAHLGALLLGYYDAAGMFQYAGHTGGGFDRASLEAMYQRLARLARRTSPFATEVHTNAPAHWVRPSVVVEVKFAEWTSDGRLRQPIFLGVRDDKAAKDVHREGESVQQLAGRVRLGAAKRAAASAKRGTTKRGTTKRGAAKRGTSKAGTTKPGTAKRGTAKAATTKRGAAKRPAGSRSARAAAASDMNTLNTTGGALALGRGKTLEVSNLDKVFFPADGITKGDVMRYYASVAPAILPHLDGRPLILKRFPGGIDGPSFFQQNAGESVPDGVRVADVAADGADPARRIIGGDLLTLLYTVQLGTIAVHPWQSRVASIEFADYSTIDLDPGKGVTFDRVVELARRIKQLLDELGLQAGLKTSGSRGLHIVLPLPPKTTYERSAALAASIAERVATSAPALATTERRLQRRPRGTIYVDAQQNARGKSVASVYSLREKPGAPASAPLEWEELTPSLSIAQFNIETMPDRLAKRGDLWATAMRQRNTARTIAAVIDA